MSHWNHRVVKRKVGDEFSFGIHEVFYNDYDEVTSYTVEPVAVDCESVADLREILTWMLSCLDNPILVDGEVEFAKE